MPEYLSYKNCKGKDTSIILTCYKAFNSNQAGVHRDGCENWIYSVLRKKGATIAWNYLIWGRDAVKAETLLSVLHGIRGSKQSLGN